MYLGVTRDLLLGDLELSSLVDFRGLLSGDNDSLAPLNFLVLGERERRRRLYLLSGETEPRVLGIPWDLLFGDLESRALLDCLSGISDNRRLLDILDCGEYDSRALLLGDKEPRVR